MLLASALGAVYAPDPDIPPALKAIFAPVSVRAPPDRAEWRLKWVMQEGSEGGLSRLLPVTPGRHTLVIKAWTPQSISSVRANYEVLERPPPINPSDLHGAGKPK